MFASKHKGTVIAKGIKIVGSVTAEGLVEVNGQIDGELHGLPCRSISFPCCFFGRCFWYTIGQP